MEHLEKFDLSQAKNLSREGIEAQLLPLLQELDSTTGKDQSICIVDSGIGVGHQEFVCAQAERRIHNHAEPDEYGHGTHMSSLIIGENIGFAPECELHVYKCFNRSLHTDVQSVVGALTSVLVSNPNKERRILNLGFFCKKNSLIDKIIDDLICCNFVCLAPAGNQEISAEEFTPASHPQVITVGACDTNKQRLERTGYGTNVNAQILGENILGAHHKDPQHYFKISGTSAACAIASALAARYFEKYPNKEATDLATFLGQTLKA